MSDQLDDAAVAALRKKRQFKKFTYKGLELEKLLDLNQEELSAIVCARARRRMQRGLKRKPMALIKKLRKAKAGEWRSGSLCLKLHCLLLSSTTRLITIYYSQCNYSCWSTRQTCDREDASKRHDHRSRDGRLHSGGV